MKAAIFENPRNIVERIMRIQFYSMRKSAFERPLHNIMAFSTEYIPASRNKNEAKLIIARYGVDINTALRASDGEEKLCLS